MARGGGGALPDLSRLAVTPTGQMVPYDPATSNGHDACAITHEEFEEGEMVWRNSEDGPITALYKPEAIYRWLHTLRDSKDSNGLWEDPVTRKDVSYARETNPADGLLRWMSAKNATPIVIDADPKELQYMPLFWWRNRFLTNGPHKGSDSVGPVRRRSYQWTNAVNWGLYAVTGKMMYFQFDIEYANGEKAHICYARGAVLQESDSNGRGKVWGPGTYYRMVGTRYGINVYRLTNMPGHLMSILRKFHLSTKPMEEVNAAIIDAEQNQRTDLLPELYEKQKRFQPQVAQAQDFAEWMRVFAYDAAPAEKEFIDVSAGTDTGELAFTAFGGGMETLSPLDAIRAVPLPGALWYKNMRARG